MLETIIRQMIRSRWIVMMGALTICAFGVWNFQNLPIDAVRTSPMSKYKSIPKHPDILRWSPNNALRFLLKQHWQDYRNFLTPGHFPLTACLRLQLFSRKAPISILHEIS